VFSGFNPAGSVYRSPVTVKWQKRNLRRAGRVYSPKRELLMETYDPHKNSTETRQANSRKMNLRVLVLSIGGIVVLFVLLYILYSFLLAPQPVTP